MQTASLTRRLRIADAYGRPFNNLRLSVTAECNYKCIFCHVEGEPIEGPARIGTLPPRITPEEYGIIAEAAWLLGAESFKLTGGEPLIRKDIVEVVEQISLNAPGSDVSMTTNGYLLEKLAGPLAEAGLRRVNISIHSLDRERYRFITGVDGLERGLRGLEAALAHGLRVKINAVILRSVNDSEIGDLIRFAASRGVTLQLIELHPVGLGAKFFDKYFYPLSRVEKELLEEGAHVERRSLHNRPVYITPDGARVEIVRPYANPLFCAGCTRLRVGPYGDVSPCLNWKGPRPSIIPVLRRRGPREEKVLGVARILLEANSMRRPFFLARIGDGSSPSRVRPSRIPLPKKSRAAYAIRELERLLLGRGSR